MLSFPPSSWFHNAPETEDIPSGFAVAGLPVVPGGSGKHSPRHSGIPGSQRLPFPLPSSSTLKGKELFFSYLIVHYGSVNQNSNAALCFTCCLINIIVFFFVPDLCERPAGVLVQ